MRPRSSKFRKTGWASSGSARTCSISRSSAMVNFFRDSAGVSGLEFSGASFEGSLVWDFALRSAAITEKEKNIRLRIGTKRACIRHVLCEAHAKHANVFYLSIAAAFGQAGGIFRGHDLIVFFKPLIGGLRIVLYGGRIFKAIDYG